MARAFQNRAVAWVAIACAIAAAVAAVILGNGSRARAASTTAATAAPIRCQEPGRKPITVVLVHGAWADPSSWDGELKQLQGDGCSVFASDNPVQDLTTDSEEVAAFVRSIPGPVLLVGHSYGGSVITNAAAEAPNVVGLVYVDAFAPAVGETAPELDGKTSALSRQSASQLYNDLPAAQRGAKELLLKQGVYLHNFASDLPRAEAMQFWASQTEASTRALLTPSRYEAWKTLPSWYFISTGDQIITPQAELLQAHRAHSQVTMFQGGSHITLISHPAAVTAEIGKALATLLAEGK